MLESGVQVTNIYLADLHGNEFISSLDGPGEPCFHAPDALASGSACYIAQAQYYNQAFGTFFQRLAKDGITAQNTLFVVSSDEGDHEAGANVGRAIQPTPASCDGATVSGDTVTPDVLCTYPSGSFGDHFPGPWARVTRNTCADTPAAAPGVRDPAQPGRLAGTRDTPTGAGREGTLVMAQADADNAVELHGTVAVRGEAVNGKDPDAIVAQIERTRENLAQTIDTLAERVSPANNVRRLREQAMQQAARPEVRLAAAAVGLAILGVAVIRIWGRRRK